ncbi:MAG: glutamine amidotransferase-related protein, partial [Bacteroidia bacterium]
LFGSPHVLDNYIHSEQLDLVEITNEGLNSKMFIDLPDHVATFLENNRSMFYSHSYGFNLSIYHDYDDFRRFFIVTAKATDDHGKEFIAAMEANQYPIYTVQYHPERIISEWKNQSATHPHEAVQAALLQALFLISEAKKNNHIFQRDQYQQIMLRSSHEEVFINASWPKVSFYSLKL